MPPDDWRNLPTPLGDRPPSRRAQVSRPHFRPIQPIVDSPHEQAVIDAGYPWVRTNPLVPTWMSPGADPRSIGRVPHKLNWHGHHGVNTHLIVEGDLTLLKPKKMFGQDHIAAVTLSTDLGTPKELSVAPDEIYLGTTQQACKFVEGHRCLSPTSAHRVRKFQDFPFYHLKTLNISPNSCYAAYPGTFRQAAARGTGIFSFFIPIPRIFLNFLLQ